jgi:hypothetical protein
LRSPAPVERYRHRSEFAAPYGSKKRRVVLQANHSQPIGTERYESSHRAQRFDDGRVDAPMNDSMYLAVTLIDLQLCLHAIGACGQKLEPQ